MPTACTSNHLIKLCDLPHPMNLFPNLIVASKYLLACGLTRFVLCAICDGKSGVVDSPIPKIGVLESYIQTSSTPGSLSSINLNRQLIPTTPEPTTAILFI